MRIADTSGYADVPAGAIDPFRVSVTFIPAPTCADQTPLRLLTKGEPEADIDEGRASVILAEEDLEIDIDLGNGEAEAQFWTCDFSHEYVTINGDVSRVSVGREQASHHASAGWLRWEQADASTARKISRTVCYCWDPASVALMVALTGWGDGPWPMVLEGAKRSCLCETIKLSSSRCHHKPGVE